MDLVSVPSEVGTLPGAPDVGSVPPHCCGSTGQPGGEEPGAAAAGEFPKLPLSVFFFSFSFLDIPPAQICCSLQGLSSHTAYLSSYARDYPGQDLT